ncbi:MAG: S24 family peptidase [Pseudorhodobacter sp.]|nr:S24 family peptidase [Pseudorhodobacter sp.]
MSDSPGKRLAAFRKSLGMSQRAFAASLGTSQARVGSMETDSAEISRAFLRKISERYRVSADWLLHGAGEMLLTEMPGFAGRSRRIEPAEPGKPLSGDFRFDGEDFAMITRMDLSVSAGSGLIPIDGGQSEALAFSRSWLMRNHISADLSVLVRVQGDSMAPGIPDGALALVHCGERQIEGPGVYAFNRGEASYVKRITPVSRKPLVWVIASDNPAYPPETVSGSDLNEIRPVGRVRCVMVTL